MSHVRLSPTESAHATFHWALDRRIGERGDHAPPSFDFDHGRAPKDNPC